MHPKAHSTKEDVLQYQARWYLRPSTAPGFPNHRKAFYRYVDALPPICTMIHYFHRSTDATFLIDDLCRRTAIRHEAAWSVKFIDTDTRTPSMSIHTHRKVWIVPANYPGIHPDLKGIAYLYISPYGHGAPWLIVQHVAGHTAPVRVQLCHRIMNYDFAVPDTVRLVAWMTIGAWTY